METLDLPHDLATARDALTTQGAQAVVRALREWALRWRDPVGEIGEEGVRRLSASTGWPRDHLVEALRRAFSPWAGSAFERKVLAAWAGHASSMRRDLWLLAVLAGRIPALVTGAVFRSLAAGLPVVLKPSSAEPVFSEVLVASARRHSDLLGQAICVVSDPEVWRSLVSEAPICLAYGRDETMDAIRRARSGRGITFYGGHRESLVLVFCEACPSEFEAALLARRIAIDCAIYDQTGCLSPHVVLYEEGGPVDAARFAHLLFQALETFEQRWPQAPLSLFEAATIRVFLDESRLLARGSGGSVLLGHDRPTPAVVLVPQGQYTAGPGHRVVQVLTFRGRPDLGRLVPSLAGRLQGLALAGPRARLRDALRRAPAFRAPYVCRPGFLQRPPPAWRENGWDLTRELVRQTKASSPP